MKTLMQWNANFENPCSAIAPRCDLLPNSIFNIYIYLINLNLDA